MSWFNWSKKSEKPFEFLLPFFDETSTLLVDFNTGENVDDDDRCGLVEILTSSSALVAAAYYMKFYMIYNGKIDQIKNTELTNIINPFFALICEVTLHTAEKETGKKFDREDWFKNITRIQSEKIKKYSQAILTTMKKGKGVSIGADISSAITEDLYDKEILDILLSVKLFDITSRVNNKRD